MAFAAADPVSHSSPAGPSLSRGGRARPLRDALPTRAPNDGAPPVGRAPVGRARPPLLRTPCGDEVVVVAATTEEEDAVLVEEEAREHDPPPPLLSSATAERGAPAADEGRVTEWALPCCCC